MGDVVYPKCVFFIVADEFCERFSFYGMRALLSLYLNRKLHYSKVNATVIYHTFMTACYFFPLLGAMLADSCLGKFRTIFYLSVIYSFGNLTLAVASTPYLDFANRLFSLIGLFLIAFGTGGIKPCVSSFGGDQFMLPQQEKQLQQFFFIFYFSVNCGSFISTLVTPYLKHNVHCFGDESCYALAFGVPAVLMYTALFIFLLGAKWYVMKKPKENVMLRVFMCISHALRVKIFTTGEKKSHWLDYADDKYDQKFIEDVKLVLRVLILLTPIPVFWALFEQQGSRWTFQATHLDGTLGDWALIEPEQMQVINPLLILILIPLFQSVIYPLFAKCHLIRRPLQRISVGGLLAALAFVVSGILEIHIEDTYAVLPGKGVGQIRLYNGLNCSIIVDSNSDYLKGKTEPYGILQTTNITSKDVKKLSFTVKTDCPSSNVSHNWTGKIDNEKSGAVAISYIIVRSANGSIEGLRPPKDDSVRKSMSGNPRLRLMYKIDKSVTVKLNNGKFSHTYHLKKDKISTESESLFRMFGKSKVTIDGKDYGKIDMRSGGVYSMLIIQTNDTFVTKLYTIQKKNSVHMLWQFPQYAIMTCAEIMVSITGLELSYSQAPPSMKSVVTAIWLLTSSVGNLIVAFITEIRLHSEVFEYFLFAGMMVAVMCIFMIIASFYKYVPVTNELSEQEAEAEALS